MTMTFEDDARGKARQIHSELAIRVHEMGQQVPEEADYATPQAWLEALLTFKEQEDEAIARDD